MRLTRFIAPLAVAGLLLTGCSSATTSQPTLSPTSSSSPGKAIGGKLKKDDNLQRAHHLYDGKTAKKSFEGEMKKKETDNG